jgi:hypothetical protein
VKAIGEWLNTSIFLPGIEFALKQFVEVFNGSLITLQTEVGKTPSSFSSTIVGVLRDISDNVLMPIAGLLLTYIFCYELINMITEKNNMAEFDVQGLFFLILRTTIAVFLITNCFDITLAFFDVGQELVTSATSHASWSISLEIGDVITTLKAEIGSNFGMGIIVLMFSNISMVVAFVAMGLIYLVAWSRIVTILIYISVAPLPFATFMSKDWIGHIGQNYLKNLMALALQGFLMVVCMIIYGGLVSDIVGTIGADNAIIKIVGLLVCMFVCVKALMSCSNIAKSIFGAQ